MHNVGVREIERIITWKKSVSRLEIRKLTGFLLQNKCDSILSLVFTNQASISAVGEFKQ